MDNNNYDLLFTYLNNHFTVNGLVFVVLVFIFVVLVFITNEGATRSVVNEGATRSVVITNRAPHRFSTNFEFRTETTTVAVLYQLLLTYVRLRVLVLF